MGKPKKPQRPKSLHPDWEWENAGLGLDLKQPVICWVRQGLGNYIGVHEECLGRSEMETREACRAFRGVERALLNPFGKEIKGGALRLDTLYAQ